MVYGQTDICRKNKKDYIFSMDEPVYSDGNGKLYYMNSIIKGNSLEVLRHFLDRYIDMIFADPPYFMQSTEDMHGNYKKLMRAEDTGEYMCCDDEWDKYDGYLDYDKFCMEWILASLSAVRI